MNLWDYQQVLAREVMIYLRLRAPQDKREIQGGTWICSALSYLLAEHLKFDPTWKSRQRWIDGLMDTDIIWLTARSLRLTGSMVWGLVRDIGGEQWAEPFEAILAVTEKNVLRYVLWFGDQRKPARKRVGFGLYSIVGNINEDPSAEAAVDSWRPLRTIGYLHQFAGEVQA